jgi:lipopolysaccharide/colanic/teichoic acid biosynthesis glycosyltransferase
VTGVPTGRIIYRVGRSASEGSTISTRPRRSQSELVWLLLAIDIVAFAFAIAVAGAFRLRFADVLDLNPSDRARVVDASVLALPLLLGIFRVSGMYDIERFPGGRREYSGAVRAVTAAAIVGLSASYFSGETFVSRSWLLATWALCSALVVLGRFVARRVVREMRRRGRLRTRLLIVGASDFGVVAARRASDPAEGYELVGFLDEAAPLGQRVEGDLVVIGRPGDLALRAHDLTDEIVVVPGALSYERLEALLQQLVLQGAPVRLAEISVPVSWRSPAKVFLKRAMDVVGATVGLVVLSPLIAVIPIAIKVSSAGPVLYPWRVVGQGGRPFVGYKFRTMSSNADALKPQLLANNEMRGPVFKMRQDPRITPLGRFLRRYSLDELPQLWSVLRGEMSLVGPRPPFQHEFAAFTPDQRAKLSVKPGMTCLWQISGRSQISDFDEWLELDLEYIRTWSLLLDLKILLKTFPAVITRRGAY